MHKYIVILGAGESGTGAALLAKSRGYDVFVSDSGAIADKYLKDIEKYHIRYEQGVHSYAEIHKADMIVKSPGIPENAGVVSEAKERQIPVISEIEFASMHTRAKFIAITGTNGKTTTTRLTYHLLKTAGFDVGIAGNIGDSLARQVIVDDKEWYVVELSSFQLDGMHSFHPKVSILLNITPDHLDRYDYDFDRYAASKFRIIQNLEQSDYLIYLQDDEEILSGLKKSETQFIKQSVSIKTPHAFASVHELHLQIGELQVSISDIPLKGKHNFINVMCSVTAALDLGADAGKVLEGLKSYQNAPHRLELIDTINGVLFINDSKATNVASVYYALDTYDNPLTWIAGGIDKGNNYDKLKPLVEKKVQSLICLGVDNSKLREAFQDVIEKIFETDNIKEAARKAYEYSQKNDVVLLSPACASFDLFKNYEDRGNQFREAVRELKNKVELIQ